MKNVKMMKRHSFLIFKYLNLFIVAMMATSSFAVTVKTDRTWYLAGEAMRVSVTADSAMIAYAELCDTHGLAAGIIVSCPGGRTPLGNAGTGVIELPPYLHSGYYLLSVYTRSGTGVAWQLVAVVNPLHKSEDDDIEWVESDTTCCLTPRSAQGGACPGKNPWAGGGAETPETEGHIIRARVKNVCNGQTFGASQICAVLSIVGKQIHYFEGKMVNDSMAVFHTFGLHGKLPLVLSAKTAAGESLPVELVSPFATLLPKQLPHLVFRYVRSEVEARSLDMQRHQQAIAPARREQQPGGHADDSAEEEVVPLGYDETVFGTKPDLSYNLDEYRQFPTIREVLVEYVVCVSKISQNGVPRLIVRREEDHYNSSLPTLVLIDGMPVADIEQLLNYDARRVHYINIYGGQYTFGNGIYNGILSFVTRSGRLTNYPTEPNVQYLVYDFPE